jgi:hypothetical protein
MRACVRVRMCACIATMLCHSHNLSVYRYPLTCVRLCLFLTKIVVGVCLRACTGVRMHTSGMVRFVPGAPTSRANVNDAVDPHVRLVYWLSVSIARDA